MTKTLHSNEKSGPDSGMCMGSSEDVPIENSFESEPLIDFFMDVI